MSRKRNSLVSCSKIGDCGDLLGDGGDLLGDGGDLLGYGGKIGGNKLASLEATLV